MKLMAHSTPAVAMARRRALRNGLVAFLLFGLTACTTTPKVHSEGDAAVDFSRYRTFAVLPLQLSGAGVDPGAAVRLGRPSEEAVRQALQDKGLTEVAREKADCAVLVRGESLPKVEVTSLGYVPVYMGRARVYYPGTAGPASVQTSEERRLIVEVYDNASKRLAWTGWLERSGTGKVEPDKVQAGIRRILEGFPPPK